MKNFILFLALVIMPSVSLSQSLEEKTISVTGEAEVKVVPDEVIIYMRAETKEKSLIEAKNQNDRIVKDVISFAKSLNIAEKDIQTDYVNVRPEYENCYRKSLGSCDPSKATHYNVTKGIQIKLSDLRQYEKLISRSLELGVKYINDVQFVTSELRKHRDKARELASKAAIEKAKDVAQVFDVKVGKPLSINIDMPNYFYYGSSRREAMSQNVVMSSNIGGVGGDVSTLSLGQISIKARVNAVFEVE